MRSKPCTGCSYLVSINGNNGSMSYICTFNPPGNVTISFGRPTHDVCPKMPMNLNDTHSDKPTITD